MEIFKNFDTVTHALFRIGDLGVVVVYMTFEFVYWWNGCYMSIFRHKRTLKIQWFKKVGLKQRMILCRRVMFLKLSNQPQSGQFCFLFTLTCPVYISLHMMCISRCACMNGDDSEMVLKRQISFFIWNYLQRYPCTCGLGLRKSTNDSQNEQVLPKHTFTQNMLW